MNNVRNIDNKRSNSPKAQVYLDRISIYRDDVDHHKTAAVWLRDRLMYWYTRAIYSCIDMHSLQVIVHANTMQ